MAFVHALVAFLLISPLSGAGAPIINEGRYFFNNHGVFLEVTEAQFHFQRSVSLRLLYLVSAVYLLGARRRADP